MKRSASFEPGQERCVVPRVVESSGSVEVQASQGGPSQVDENKLELQTGQGGSSQVDENKLELRVSPDRTFQSARLEKCKAALPQKNCLKCSFTTFSEKSLEHHVEEMHPGTDNNGLIIAEAAEQTRLAALIVQAIASHAAEGQGAPILSLGRLTETVVLELTIRGMYFHTFDVGMQVLGSSANQLSLVRDRHNENDSNAIKLLVNGILAAFVAKEESEILAPFLDELHFPGTNYTLAESNCIKQYEGYDATIFVWVKVPEGTICGPIVPLLASTKKAEAAAAGPVRPTFAPASAPAASAAASNSDIISIPRWSSNFKPDLKGFFSAAPNQGSPEPMQSHITDEYLVSIGYWPLSDTASWAEYGLNSPMDWALVGPSMCEYEPPSLAGGTRPTRPEQEREQEIFASVMSAGTMWTFEMQKWIFLLLKQPIWSKHPEKSKVDQLIAVFGCPYVLGQRKMDLEDREGGLKLVKPLPNTDITSKMLAAKNIAYHVMFGKPPPTPFNVLIFGLTWRTSGFYYHADQCKLGGRSSRICLDQR